MPQVVIVNSSYQNAEPRKTDKKLTQPHKHVFRVAVPRVVYEIFDIEVAEKSEEEARLAVRNWLTNREGTKPIKVSEQKGEYLIDELDEADDFTAEYIHSCVREWESQI